MVARVYSGLVGTGDDLHLYRIGIGVGIHHIAGQKRIVYVLYQNPYSICRKQLFPFEYKPVDPNPLISVVVGF